MIRGRHKGGIEDVACTFFVQNYLEYIVISDPKDYVAKGCLELLRKFIPFVNENSANFEEL